MGTGYNSKYKYDIQQFPGKSILNSDYVLNNETKKQNRNWIIYFKDYEIGLEFYNKFWKKDYIKHLSGVDSNYLISWINKLQITDSEKNDKILMLKASINQLSFNINQEIELTNNNLFLLLNLINSLNFIFKKDLKKLHCKWWDLKDNLDFINNYDFEIFDKLFDISDSTYKNFDKTFFEIKTIRDILSHYYNYQKPDKKNKYILLKQIFYKNYFFLFVIKNQSNLKVYRYDFIEIKNVLIDYLKEF